MKPLCCPRCQNVYSIRLKGEQGRPEKGPLLLRCGHNCCEGCLRKLAKSDTVSCPTCQLPTKVGASHELHKYLHPDLYVVGLLTARKMDLEVQSRKIFGNLPDKNAGYRKGQAKVLEAARPEAVCSECQVNAATCLCVKCDCIMCQPCFDKVHHMSYSLRKHQSMPYTSESEQRSVLKKTRSRTCETHDQCHIEYFCRDDRKAICSRCVIMGEHKGHNVQTMEDKNKEALSEMEPAVQLAQEVVWRLGKAEKTLKDAVPAARVDTRDIVDEVRQHFTHLHSLLQAREDTLLSEIQEASLSAVNPLQELTTYLTEEKMNLEAAVMDAARAMQGNVHHMIDADLVLERLKHAKDIACVVTPQSNAPESAVGFCCEKGSLQEAIASYGKISTSSQSQMFSVGLPTAESERPPLNLLRMPSLGETDSMSTTDTESFTDTSSVFVEEEKEENVVPETVEIKPAVYPPLKRLTVGHCEKVMVTHIRTPAQFYVQLHSQAADLTSLSRQINNYCRTTSKKDIPEILSEGDIVLAQYSHDKVWYRARVTEVMDSESSGNMSVEVMFIDYGNSEVTSQQKIRNIQKKFVKAPAFVHECALFDIVPFDEHGWSPEAVQTMFKMTNSKPMIMTVVSTVGGVLQVDLSRPESERHCLDDRPVSVRDSLVFLEMAVFQTGSHLTDATSSRSKRDYVTLPRTQLFNVLDVGINCAHSPSIFYCQNHGDRATEYLRQLLINLQDCYKEETRSLYTIYCPKKGMICAAQYSKDGNWYRARVTGLPGGRRVEVQFVDYGNVEVVDHTYVCKILDEYVKFPAQAMECVLADVEPVDESGEWSEEAQVWFASHVTLQLCQFRVTKESKKPNAMEGALYVINIDNNALCCLNVELVQQGFARSTGVWSQVENFSGITMKAFDQEVPQLFEQDLAAAASAPYHPMHQRVDAQSASVLATSPTPASLLPGTSAVYPCSDTLSTSSSSTLSPTRKTDGREKSPKAKSPGKNHRVASQRSKPSEPSKPVGDAGKRKSGPDAVSVSISAFESPANFHIQLKEKEDELKKLIERMKVYDTAATTRREWKAGEFCAAKCAGDGCWYRARILRGAEDDICEVQMVDFGFRELLPTCALHILKKKHAEYECYAERCHLADLVPAGSTDRTTWSKTGIEFVLQQLKGKELFVKLEGAVVEGMGLPVDILIEETIPETAFEPPGYEYVSLTEMLLDKGLALPDRRRKTLVVTQKSDPFHTKVVVTSGAEEEEEENEVEEPMTQDPAEVKNDVIIVQQDLDIRPHDPPLSTALTLMPVYVDFDGIIYAHDSNEEDTNSVVFESIEEYVRTEAPEGRLEVKVGQICLAHYVVDNVWYRAKVLEVDEDTAKVQYVDFGNTCVLERRQLKLATPDFCRTPQLAYLLRLHNMKPDTDNGAWPVSFLDYIHCQVVNFKCTVEVKGNLSDVPLEVDVILSDGRNLSGVLMAMGVAVPKNDMEEFYQRSIDIGEIIKHSNPFFPLCLGKVDSVKHVLVTHMELPNLVYLQRSPPEPDPTMSQDHLRDLNAERESLAEFVQLMADLNNLPPQTPALGEVPAAGEVCSAKYSEDNRWYRGLVAKAYPATKTALIFYADYGNSEVVPLQRLRVLPARFQDTPAQAVRAYLNVGLPDDRKRWTLNDFTSMANSVYLMRHAAVIKNTDPMTVELYMENALDGTSVLSYQQLINNGTVIPAAGYFGKEGQNGEDGVLIESDTESDEEATVPV